MGQKQEDFEFEACLGCIARLVSKSQKKKKGNKGRKKKTRKKSKVKKKNFPLPRNSPSLEEVKKETPQA